MLFLFSPDIISFSFNYNYNLVLIIVSIGNVTLKRDTMHCHCTEHNPQISETDRKHRQTWVVPHKGLQK